MGKSIGRNSLQRLLSSGGLSFLFAIIFSFSCVGQNRSTFTGEMTLLNNSTSGKATYEYLVIDGDTLKDGNFDFSYTRPDTGEFEFLKGVNYTGNYEKDVKTGEWAYSVKYFKPVQNPKVEGFEIKYPGTGKENVILAGFENGAAHGTWNFFEYKVEQGEPSDTLFSVSSSFLKGGVKGDFKGFSAGIKSTGSFDDAGFIHGNWEFIHEGEKGEKLKEIRIYEHGVLQSHTFEKNGETHQIELIGLDTSTAVDSEAWEQIIISDKYFNVLKNTGHRLSASDEHPEEQLKKALFNRSNSSNEFLKKALYCFGKHEDIPVWHLTGGSDSITYARVKLRKYPYKSTEEKSIEKTAANLNKALDITRDFFEDAQVDISRHSYEDVAYYFEVFKHYKPELNRLKSVITDLKSPAFLYIDREKLFPVIYKPANLIREIEFEFDDQKKVKVHEFPAGVDFDKSYFEELERFSSAILVDIQGINDSINEILEKYKKEKRLREKEEVLVQKRDTVLSLYSEDNTLKNYNDFHRESAKAVSEFAEKTFKNYAARETEKRLKIADSLASCFDELVALYKVQTKIPEKLERLDDLYTRTVWNPYTMTDMDERVKERLYSAYEKDVLTRVLALLKSDFECTSIESNAKLINQIYSYMVAVREEDTKDLERELRRASGSSQRREILMKEIKKEN